MYFFLHSFTTSMFSPHSLLEAMKEVRALDQSRDGYIDEREFQRLNLPEVREAAEAWLDPASHQVIDEPWC